MALGKRNRDHQGDMFVSTNDIRASWHAFYRALNKLLVSNGFEGYVEALCRGCYADNVGRFGLPPGPRLSKMTNLGPLFRPISGIQAALRAV